MPFGRYKSPYFPQQEMEGFIQKSDRVELMCGDFQTTLSLADNTDTVYCDPPYAPLSPTASFTTYAKEGFNLDDQIRLAQTAQQIAPNSQGVLISNHDTEFTRNIYSSAILKTVEVQRNMRKGQQSQKSRRIIGNL